VTIKANLNEFQAIAAFCREHSSAPFRFDPLIHLRFDRDETKNKEIRNQRLSPEEIAALERSDEARHNALRKNCEKLILPSKPESAKGYIFSCGAGVSDFVISHNGYIRLCSSLWNPDCMCDLRKRTIQEARETLVPEVRSRQITDRRFIEKCGTCSIVNLCIWCPAHAFLETGYMERHCRYFCETAETRRKSIQRSY
jgi:radical SAM protein with 4Fe4S-binding SPASM domain